ncbi:SCO-spondin-like isoform X3 [Gigantopelta aegis]|uniref:SCO-spondin-like isoform X3 n=1 Tax=Gigantopelta aegis TaxID=1735272 RepID=UPI001B88E641|nr:SCO-spondin-like isoform X3 [Gigantopelta aegis]
MGPTNQSSSCMDIKCKGLMRLQGGTEYGEGRVEIFNNLNKEWGLVCADQWGMFAADLVCKQLGLPGAFAAVTDGRYGNGAGKYSITSLTCTGSERTVQMCKRNPWTLTTSCSTTNGAAGVQCNVNGVWSLWGSWGSCSVTCADGIEQRTRQCDHPPVLHGGKPCPGDALQTRPCTLPLCPVDGVWMTWESWSPCSETCGEGTQTRSRSCKGPFHGGRECLGSQMQTQACQDKACPVDGYWRHWLEWGPCNVTCGGGRQKRERVCVEPQYGGKACSGAAVEWRDCGTNNCPVDGHWMDWGQWGTCNVSCGGGIQKRSRECYQGQHGGIDCVGGLPEEERQCNTHKCPVDGVWDLWGVWSNCTDTCGNGTQTRSRTCRGPFFGGQDCDGPKVDIRHCNTHSCAVDGVWETWLSWSSCDVSCGNGTKMRKRACAGPYYGGNNCSGLWTEQVHCFLRPCPVDGTWQTWGSWSTCPVSCGGGSVSRHRSCDGPFHGGEECAGNYNETQICGSQPCPIDGFWEAWSSYSSCSTTCGGGIQFRYRTCVPPKYGGADCKGESQEHQSCNDNPCPVDGVFAAWTDWSTCSTTCGGGETVRTRTCTEPLHGGSNCSGAWRQNDTCNTQPCPVDGVWKPWGTWSACDLTCGGGTRSRLRECEGPYFGGKECDGSESETETCSVQHCPVDGVWDVWSDWDSCSLTCGGGIQWRTRNCTGPFYGGQDCAGSANQSRDCNAQLCPVDGYFNEWAPWSECDVTCNGGIRWRNRTCMGPLHGGNDCQGQWNQTEACNTQQCPVDGVFSDWSDWGECSVTCGGGIKWRTRTCTGPFYNGADCVGARNDSTSCNENNCPVDGVYNDWSAWSTCTVTCGGGTQWHSRTCVGPFFGGLPCQGPARETQDCNTQHCPIDGVYNDWSQWDTCTVTCGGGTQSRSRTCTKPQYGGRDCQGPVDDWQDCNTQNCPVDGVWYSWSAWGACNTTCGGGARERTRDCEKPKYGGADCIGHSSEYLVCNENPCPIPGDWFPWEPWPLCSATCGGGKRQRQRECDMTSYGDLTAPCAGDAKEIEDCHTFACTPYAATCTEWGERGLKESTMAHIDPFKKPEALQQPILVYCDMESEDGTGVTVIGHDQQQEEEVIGYEGAGEFQLEITYNVTLEEAIAIIDNSKSCKQFISWKCKAALIHNPYGKGKDIITTGWKNRTGQIADYFGGATPGSGKCQCGMTNSCVNTTMTCNCDTNDNVWREDSGFLTYKDDLPVVEFIAGDTGDDGTEAGYYKIGPVQCQGEESTT